MPKRRLGGRLPIVTCVCYVFFSAPFAEAQQNTVTARVQVENGQAATPTKSPAADASEVVLWLVPLDVTPPDFTPGKRLRVVQKNKSFHPHLIVVPVSAMVLTLFSVVLIGEAVREAFDPKVFSRLR